MLDVIDAYDVGRRVYEAGARGRAKILEQRRRRLRVIGAMVRQYAKEDADNDYPEHGRAARIARRIRTVPTRTVYRVYADLAEWQKDSDSVQATHHQTD